MFNAFDRSLIIIKHKSENSHSKLRQTQEVFSKNKPNFRTAINLYKWIFWDAKNEGDS